jgi:hypothetical protein
VGIFILRAAFFYPSFRVMPCRVIPTPPGFPIGVTALDLFGRPEDLPNRAMFCFDGFQQGFSPSLVIVIIMGRGEVAVASMVAASGTKTEGGPKNSQTTHETLPSENGTPTAARQDNCLQPNFPVLHQNRPQIFNL